MRENATPNMEDGKCKENCTWKDEYGYCTNGDTCLKYGCNNVTMEPIERPASKYETSFSSTTNSPQIPLVMVQNILGAQLLKLADTTLSAKQRMEARDTAREISAVAKQYMSGVDLYLKAYGLMATNGVDKDGIKGLLE